LGILQKFIDRKVDIDCIDGQKRTPLMWAASTGYKLISFSEKIIEDFLKLCLIRSTDLSVT
jgi:hypothetical protein